MRTIAFYSYKGGTGRTLVVANAAEYVLRLGLKVFVIDLDLEAPGLHYKLRLAPNAVLPAIERGVVDYLTDFLTTGHVPDSVRPFTIEVPHREDQEGRLDFMPAGTAPSADYWRKLSQINWHRLFYSEDAFGIPFFLELKERIKAEFAPDLLFIDARTGITEIGGVATCVLPDQVVCLLGNNEENLEGARAVLRSIKQAARLPGQGPVDVVPVLSRLPLGRTRPRSVEVDSVGAIRDFLCKEGDCAEATLSFPEVLVLHSEEDLQYKESLRVGGDRTVEQSPLLRDYLRLFSRIIPKELVEPRLGKLIVSAQRDMVENPSRVQQELEALAIYSPHPESYLALLKFYRLRNAASKVMLNTAARYWELARDASNPVLWEVVREHFKFRQELASRERDDAPLDFVEAVWDHAGGDNVEIGLQLADAYAAHPYTRNKSVELLQRLVANSSADEGAVVGAIDRLTRLEEVRTATSLVETFSQQHGGSAAFQAAWARLLIATGDAASAKRLADLKDFRPAKLQSQDPLLYVRLLKLAGQEEELGAALKSALVQTVSGPRGGFTNEFLDLSCLYMELGRRDQLEQHLRQILPKAQADRVLERFQDVT